MELPAPIQSQIDDIFEANERFYRKKEYNKCIELHKAAWALFPEPKYAYENEGYALIQGLVDLNLTIANLPEAEEWAKQLFLFDQSDFLGTSEFGLGKVLFAMGRMEEAKELFTVAMIQSEGRVFEDEPLQYIALLEDKFKR